MSLNDLPSVVACPDGPEQAAAPECVSGTDFDHDGDVDLHDVSGVFLSFQ